MMRILLLLILPLLAGLASAADKQATETQLKQLKRDIGSLQHNISQQQGKRSSLQQALRNSEAQIGQVGGRIDTLDKQLASLGDNANALEAKRDRLRQSLASHSDRLERQLRMEYRLGREPRLQLLLNQRDPESTERMLHYFDVINAELASRMGVYQQQLADLADTEAKLDKNRQALKASRDELSAQREKLDQARRTRAATLAKLNQSIDSDKSRLAGLRADSKRLEGVLAEIDKAIRAAKLARQSESLPKLKGKLNWPVEGRLLRSFGSTDSGIRYDGMLIAAPMGREVRAVHRGRVVFSDWLRGYGLLLIIDHGGGYLSLYGHNQRLLKKPGDWVEDGEAVATVGNSGGYSEPSLYFAVRHNGKPTDPARWLAHR